MAVTRKRRSEPGALFQIAPMIDVVFLLLIYFMVGATLQKQEADVSFQLPGVVEQETQLELPDEQILEIRADGQVVVNEHPYDRPGSAALPELTVLLTRFRQASAANKVDAIVTIAPDDATPHQVIVNVMDACARAGLEHVNFALGDEP